jgi:hypothetical protein
MEVASSGGRFEHLREHSIGLPQVLAPGFGTVARFSIPKIAACPGPFA